MARILLLEDDTDLAKLWSKILARSGHVVTWKVSPEEAWRHFEQYSADLIIADMQIVAHGIVFETAGMSLIARVRGWSIAASLRRIPIIGVSGAYAPVVGDRRSIEVVEDHGLIDLRLEKPFESVVLMEAVTRLLPPAE